MLKIDNDKLFGCGLKFDSPEDMLYYVSSLIDYLETHNKNYTKQQERSIMTLYDIIHSITIE